MSKNSGTPLCGRMHAMLAQKKPVHLSIHANITICTYTHIYIYVYVIIFYRYRYKIYIYTLSHIYIYICIYIYTYTLSTHIYIYVCVCIMWKTSPSLQVDPPAPKYVALQTTGTLCRPGQFRYCRDPRPAGFRVQSKDHVARKDQFHQRCLSGVWWRLWEMVIIIINFMMVNSDHLYYNRYYYVNSNNSQ